MAIVWPQNYLLRGLDDVRTSLVGVSDGNRIDADMKNYAKYILREGTIFEKRELLTYLKDRLLLADKIITLAK